MKKNINKKRTNILSPCYDRIVRMLRKEMFVLEICCDGIGSPTGNSETVNMAHTTMNIIGFAEE